MFINIKIFTTHILNCEKQTRTALIEVVRKEGLVEALGLMLD